MQDFTLKENDTYLQIRLPHELKEQYQLLCKSKDINPSALLRRFMIQWMKEQTQADNQQRRITDISNINQ